ncbi:hypothetical protein AQUCO_01400655v1 [Aquilegia coerulea]|uniref:Uncharacterized protein n=1 Tax=Aquilegia coerulea TaxID=218851 RepID=A0A2G5DXF7_AQUCA|nr:hypothetical protein AQUCO_01400655v1 [Aquilegia coerulea]
MRKPPRLFLFPLPLFKKLLGIPYRICLTLLSFVNSPPPFQIIQGESEDIAERGEGDLFADNLRPKQKAPSYVRHGHVQKRMEDLNDSDVDILSEGDFFDPDNLGSGPSPPRAFFVGANSKGYTGDTSSPAKDCGSSFPDKKQKRKDEGLAHLEDGFDPDCVEFSNAAHLNMASPLMDVEVPARHAPPAKPTPTADSEKVAPTSSSSKSPPPFVGFYSLIGKEGKVVSVNDSTFKDASVSFAMIDRTILPADRKWIESLTVEQAYSEYYKAMSLVNGLSTQMAGDHSGLVKYNRSLVCEKAKLEADLKKSQTVNRNLSHTAVELKDVCDKVPGLEAEG